MLVDTCTLRDDKFRTDPIRRSHDDNVVAGVAGLTEVEEATEAS